MGIPSHPLAEIFPMLLPPEAAALRADIAANGLRERIVVLDGQILDGRNRYAAAVEAGLLPQELPPEGHDLWTTHFRRFNAEQDGDPLVWVLSKNLHRRHLSTGQRAMVAAEIARLGQGRPPDSRNKPANLPVYPSQAQAAAMLNVSERIVRTGVKLREAGAPELVSLAKAGEIAPSAAVEIASLPITEQLRIMRERRHELAQAAREVKAERPRGRLAVMNSRALPPDDLDYAPTPPWATRAMLHLVLPHIGVSLAHMVVREPSCGEGHISTVLEEEAGALEVWASDIFDYSANGLSPAGWIGVRDYLDPAESFDSTDWTVMNPPFEDRAEKFVQRALEVSGVGVAAFVRLGWLSSIGRYERLFSVNPPTLIAFFSERVPLHMGRWDPAGATMTDYVWLVWVKGRQPMPPFWIPPGQRVALTRADDVERFTAHPVRPRAIATVQTHAESEAIAVSKAEALDIIRARYTGENGEDLAAALGRPVATIRKWAWEAGVSGAARGAASGVVSLAQVNARRRGEVA